MFDRNKIGYKFVFMFASPPHKFLGETKDFEKKIQPFAPLNHLEEFRRIKESIKKANIEITVNKIHGTLLNMNKLLT